MTGSVGSTYMAGKGGGGGIIGVLEGRNKVDGGGGAEGRGIRGEQYERMMWMGKHSN